MKQTSLLAAVRDRSIDLRCLVPSHVIAEALEEASITGAPAELLLNGCINA